MNVKHVVIAGAMACMSSAAWSHHSTAEFDYTKENRIEGTVEQYLWTNPHMWLHVVVLQPDGRTVTYKLETGAPNVNARMGWRKDSLKPGNKVVVTYCPNRDGSDRGSVKTVTLPDGQVLHGIADIVAKARN